MKYFILMLLIFVNCVPQADNKEFEKISVEIDSLLIVLGGKLDKCAELNNAILKNLESINDTTLYNITIQKKVEFDTTLFLYTQKFFSRPDTFSIPDTLNLSWEHFGFDTLCQPDEMNYFQVGCYHNEVQFEGWPRIYWPNKSIKLWGFAPGYYKFYIYAVDVAGNQSKRWTAKAIGIKTN